jgi:hypothetical protein
VTKLNLSKCLWVDLNTHEQKRDFLLLGRAVSTGIIAPSMQSILAHDYNVIVEQIKRIAELEEELSHAEDILQNIDYRR